jgi:hypothetical protein
VEHPFASGNEPDRESDASVDQLQGNEEQLEADDDEFDPFADDQEDPPPDSEGDDRAVAGSE